MKKYIILCVVLIASQIIIAQEQIIALENQYNINNPEENVYYKDVNNTLDKYVGIWVVDDGVHYLKIKVIKLTHQTLGFLDIIENTNYQDELLIRVVYKLNGMEIYNTIISQSSPITGNIINSENEIELHYNEPTESCFRNRTADLHLEFISNNNFPDPLDGVLKWKRRNTFRDRGTFNKCEDGTLVDESDFTIPRDFILERE